MTFKVRCIECNTLFSTLIEREKTMLYRPTSVFCSDKCQTAYLKREYHRYLWCAICNTWTTETPTQHSSHLV